MLILFDGIENLRNRHGIPDTQLLELVSYLLLQVTICLLNLLRAIIIPLYPTALKMTERFENSPVWLEQLAMIVAKISFQAATNQRMA